MTQPMMTTSRRGRPRLRHWTRRAGAAMAVAGSAILALAPATALAAGSTGQAPSAPAPAAKAPIRLERFYSQDVEWYPCAANGGMTASQTDTGFVCATIEVPLDYASPEGQSIEIAMKKRPASSGKSQGSLFVNPGGPGASGVSFVEAAPGGGVSEDVAAAYDVIGFDPRGVGASTPIRCGPESQETGADQGGGAGQTDGSGSLLADPEELEAAPAFAEEVAAYQQQVAHLAAQCEQYTQPVGLLDHVDTASVARDLDVLRALSGQDDLDYLGYSYGTYLGATYAELFPDTTGRMVLDGAMDPSLSLSERVLGQAVGFERARRAYVEHCLATGGCPLSGDAEAASAQLDAFINGLADDPVPTADPAAPLTKEQVEGAIVLALYSSELQPTLTEGLSQAMTRNDGSVLARMGGSGDGAAVNSAGMANICLDYPAEGDMAAWEAQYRQATEAAPHYGGLPADVYCRAWGHRGTREPAPIHAAGASPILVVGTAGDPATPYPWAQSLAEQLDSGQLLTWEGDGHTAYTRAGDCVSKAVDAYLLNAQTPKEGLVCTGKE